jgi:hypothetical protein
MKSYLDIRNRERVPGIKVLSLARQLHAEPEKKDVEVF